MKTLRPPYEMCYPDGTKAYYCNVCVGYCPEKSFYPSNIRRRARRCRPCHDRDRVDRRRGTVCRKMLTRARKRIRNRRDPAEHDLARAWEVKDVEDVLKRFGYTKPYPGTLTLVRIDPTKPMYPLNTWPIKTRDANGRHHLKCRKPQQVKKAKYIASTESKKEEVQCSEKGASPSSACTSGTNCC